MLCSSPSVYASSWLSPGRHSGWNRTTAAPLKTSSAICERNPTPQERGRQSALPIDSADAALSAIAPLNCGQGQAGDARFIVEHAELAVQRTKDLLDPVRSDAQLVRNRVDRCRAGFAVDQGLTKEAQHKCLPIRKD